MAKLLLSNNRYIFDTLVGIFNEAGFRTAFKSNNNPLLFSSFKKLSLDNENTYIQYDDVGSIKRVFVCVGTFFYNGKLGVDGLKELSFDYQNKCDITFIKSKSYGCFCVGIMEDKECLFFVDDYNLFNCYFSNKDGNIVVTNTYWHIAKVIEAKFNYKKAYEMAQQYAIIDGESPYYDIKRLACNQILHVNEEGCCIEPVTLKERQDYYGDKSFEELVDILCKGISYNAKLVNDNFNKISICMTGGLDSRVLLAALVQYKNPQLVYWIGDSVFTGSEDRDKDIVDLISQKLNLNTYIINAISDRFPENTVRTKEYLNRHGEFYRMFGCNEGIFSGLASKRIGEFCDYGVGTNWIKSCELAAFPKMTAAFKDSNAITLNEFIEKIYIRSDEVRAVVPWYDKYISMLEEEFERIVIREGFSRENLTKENVSLFSMEYFMMASSWNYCLTNNFTYSFPVTATKEMYRIISDSSYQYREKNHLVVEILRKFTTENKLMQIPFYSDLRVMRYNDTDGTMEEVTKTKIVNFIAKYNKYLIKGPTYDKLKKFYRRIINKKRATEFESIEYWLKPMGDYMQKSQNYLDMQLKNPLGALHHDPFTYLFYLIYADNQIIKKSVE